VLDTTSAIRLSAGRVFPAFAAVLIPTSVLSKKSASPEGRRISYFSPDLFSTSFSMLPRPFRSSKENSCAKPKLVLSIALKVSEFGIEVVGLDSSDPNVFGDGYVEASTDRECKGGVVARGQLAYRRREVAVEAVHATKQGLSEGLEAVWLETRILTPPIP
jgi:hypothetical protein